MSLLEEDAPPDPGSIEHDLPPVSRKWPLMAAIVIGVGLLVIFGIVIPILGGSLPRFGRSMVHEDDPQTAVQPDGTMLVRTAVVKRQAIESIASYTGTVLPAFEETVRPRVEGWVKEITVDDGDSVRAGDIVAVLDDAELTARAKAMEAEWNAASSGAQAAHESVGSAEAELRANEARLRSAEAEVLEARAMVDEASHEADMARAEYDARSGGLREAEAMLARAQAMAQREQSMLSSAEAKLDAARAALEGAQSRKTAAAARLAAAGAKRDQADAKRQSATRMIAEAKAELSAAEADTAFKEGVFRRDDDLHMRGAISAEEFEDSRRMLEMSRGMRDAAQARLEAAEDDLKEADAMRSEAGSMEAEAAAMVPEAAAEIAKMTADVRMAEADVEAARSAVNSALAEVEAAQGANAMAEAELRGESSAVDAAKARLEQAQAKLLATQAMVGEYEAMVDRARKMVLEAKAMARRDDSMAAGAYSAYLAERTVSDYTVIRARTSGTVTDRMVDPGSLVDPAMPILSIGSLNAVRVQVEVSEEHLGQVQEGATASIRMSNDPADITIAYVTTVFRTQDPRTRTGTVEILLDNESGRLVRNSFVRVDLVLARHDDVLVMPSSGVRTKNDVPLAYSVVDGIAHEREVLVGIDNGTMVEIIRGLDEGEVVVADGVLLLSEGRPVSTQVAPRGAAPGHGQHGSSAPGDGADAGSSSEHSEH